jgi:putative endonuclease
MYYVYIITNWNKTVFYTGVTNNLKRRINEHKGNRGQWKTFAGRNYCYKLLYFEQFDSPMVAIRREKEIKLMSRLSKLDLIKRTNPGMRFIYLK